MKNKRKRRRRSRAAFPRGSVRVCATVSPDTRRLLRRMADASNQSESEVIEHAIRSNYRDRVAAGTVDSDVPARDAIHRGL